MLVAKHSAMPAVDDGVQSEVERDGDSIMSEQEGASDDGVHSEKANAHRGQT